MARSFQLKRARSVPLTKIKPLKYKPADGYELLPQAEKNSETDGRASSKPVDSASSQTPKILGTKVDPGKLDDSLPRFGPLYGTDQQSVSGTKKKAWHHVKENSGDDDRGVTKEAYVAAVRRVEKQAREIYGLTISGTPSQFRLMMIKDGCFFLQLAFLILGKSNELGYSSRDPIFGVQNKRDVERWIESMFFVGNQIPFFVLREFMKEKFFQKVIKEGNWDSPPSSLTKRVLYELLVLPELKRRSLVPWRGANNVEDKNVSDILNGLQTLVVGPDPRDDQFNVEIESDDDYDVEANEAESAYETTSHLQAFLTALGVRKSSSADQNRRSVFPSATELKQSGIIIKKLKPGGGTRGIRFDNFYFTSFLHLPVLPVDGDTEILFRNLKAYEINQQSKLEVSSYLKFMSDLVKTQQDVKLLWRSGILVGEMEYADKLPESLGMLSSEEVPLTKEFRNLRRSIREYSSPLIRYQSIINFAVFLTFLQTLFAMLDYFNVKPSDHSKTKGH